MDNGELAGSLASSTATGQIDIPPGSSTLEAQTSFTISTTMGSALSRYAQSEQTATLITVAGKEFVVPSAVLQAGGGDQ